MKTRNKPSWWLLYLTVPLMIGALLVESQTSASVDVHRVMELGILLVSFGLMWLWVQANQSALAEEDLPRQRWNLDANATRLPDPDPHHLPLADAGESVDLEPYEIEASPSKGRYN